MSAYAKLTAHQRAVNATGRAILDLLQRCETMANDAGLLVTGHACNQAKNACGWELAGDVENAGRASRGEDIKP